MLILTLVVFSSFIIKENSAGPNIGNAASIIDSVRKPVLSVDKIASMKTKEAKKILGRKLTLKEKISLKIAQYKIKKGLKVKEKGKSSKGQQLLYFL